MTYEELLMQRGVTCLQDIINIAKELVPDFLKDKPWIKTDHGTAVYQDDIQLNCYLSAYGTMHRIKLEDLFSGLDFTQLPKSFEVIDWGCGQGIATLKFMDTLDEQNIKADITQITLIEPSTKALNRAILNIQSRSHYSIPIKAINKYLPVSDICVPSDKKILEGDDIDFQSSFVIHLFSNILDIEQLDLKRIAKLSVSKRIKHLFCCVSPKNAGNHRIGAFVQYFAKDRRKVIHEFSFVKKDLCPCTGVGIAFEVDATEHQPLCEFSYYPPKQLFASYCLDSVDREEPSSIRYAFEVLAPFDIGACVSEDISPILAVLSNLISRGRPTKASPYVESILANCLNATFDSSSDSTIQYSFKRQQILDKEVKLLRDVPIAVARLQKTILEALIAGKLSLNSDNWDILVIEQDVPCAAIAIEDLRQMFYHLTQLSQDYQQNQLPAIHLSVIASEEYREVGGIHLDAEIIEDICAVKDKYWDAVFDISIDQTSKWETVGFSDFKAKNLCYFNIRSSEGVYADRYFYTTKRINYQPLTIKNTRGLDSLIEENVKHLRYFLQLLFRKSDFRDGQLPILSRALQLRSVIGLLPTGGGKSLTYQLAALLQPGITLVVDPLISLMKDQLDGLFNNGIDCCHEINSKQDAEQKNNVLSNLENSQTLFVFLSPERLCNKAFRESLVAMQKAHIYFSYGVIDEVHCVSEWGHDFRVSYLHLGRNLYQYVLPYRKSDNSDEHISLFGLTATASFDVLADVERELSGNNSFPLDSDAVVRYENTNRLELQYRIIKVPNDNYKSKWDVYEKKSSMAQDVIRDVMYPSIKELQTDEAIDRIKTRFIERENITSRNKCEQINNFNLRTDVDQYWYRNTKCPSGAIVFCPHREGALGIDPKARSKGVTASIRNVVPEELVSTYKGGDLLSEQDRFIHNKTAIMVATKAFGMGIDKPNIRFTLNMNHSGSLEAFVQEAGRAGRDRKMALATILYCDQEFDEKTTNSGLKNEVVPVDYGVHKYFYDRQFVGPEFEKWLMYFLLNFFTVIVKNPSAGYVTYKGIMPVLNDIEPGESAVVYVSYKMGDESNCLNRKLHDHQLPKILNENQFCQFLSKTIYRLTCLDIISDFTQDYVEKKFRLVLQNKAKGEYFNGLKSFLLRYYAEERATHEIEHCKNYRGQTEIQKCLGYLTDFVYQKIAVKRKRAISDIETFCQSATNSSENWLEVNEDLKDFIYFYFNSKFARDGFVADNGEGFSLTDDTDRGRNSSYDILFKYLRVVDDDLTGAGSPKDNIKHLQGAVRLIRRSLTESNPTLSLLNAYCLLFLNVKDPLLLQELKDSYIEGFVEFYNRTDDKNYFDAMMQKFKEEISLESRGVASMEDIEKLKQWDELAFMIGHLRWTKEFANRFIN